MVVIKNLASATPEEMKELQKKELEILKYFNEVCQTNDLTFYLAGGTCIGAIRHHGFIPWDDDVDVFMIREDYERLSQNWATYSKNPKYSLCRSDESHNYHHAAMTLNDNQTTFINFRTQNEDVNQGIAIDILPIDHLASHPVSRAFQRLNAVQFSIFVNQRLPDNQGTLLRMLTGIPLALIKSPKGRIKAWKSAERRMVKRSVNSTNLVELVSGLKSMFRPLDPQWFSSVKLVAFEDTLMPVAVGYDKYLRLVFGDYMVLPPTEDRGAKHHTVIIDTEVGYENYKGKYYLVGENK